MLMTHTGSALVSAAALADLPMPIARGPMHQPVPHAALVRALNDVACTNGYTVVREQLAISRTGRRLFGVLDLVPPADVPTHEARDFAIGFRNSTDTSLAICLVAGVRVTVCDNLLLSGDLIALKKRNTSHLDLYAELDEGFNRYLAHTRTLDLQIAAMQDAALTDAEAKLKIFEIFAHKLLPLRLFAPVVENYFSPGATMTDCQPRTLWGLHNSFTRATKALRPARSFEASADLGRIFGLVERSVH